MSELSYQTMSIVIDQADAYEIANMRRWSRDKASPVFGNALAGSEQYHEEFLTTLGEAREFAEERFALLGAGDTFAPREVMKREAYVTHDESHVLLHDFEATITMRYKRHGITYLRLASNDVIASEIFIVTNWDSFRN